MDWDDVCSGFHSAMQYKSKTTKEKNTKAAVECHKGVEIDPLYSDPRKPDAKVFACKCGVHYFSVSALRLHVITMKFGNVHTCQYCLGGFHYFHSLKKHVKCIHGKNMKDFLCGFCHQKFNNHRNFSKHLVAVHDD